ncbi:O-Glycosyl hydrolases family 17 protein [Striga hermonthica]|uniref:O-Glycosyl hydrolases family 17 protein n=1 Tax=Striga hermonthica TaxID=68872 RepID=A0A9N7NX88_STRHE|nr:O-Glycosyl hydrolases family 17 protein [Striga hermonthica]
MVLGAKCKTHESIIGVTIDLGMVSVLRVEIRGNNFIERRWEVANDALSITTSDHECDVDGVHPVGMGPFERNDEEEGDLDVVAALRRDLMSCKRIPHRNKQGVAKAQEPLQLLLPLHDPTSVPRPPPLDGHPVAFHLPAEHLENVSGSVLMAETWLRSHVLPHYPSTNVTAIIVGHAVFCDDRRRRLLGLVRPAVRNLHYSLTRWGLQNDIKATTSFSSDCLDGRSDVYTDDLAENHIKPLLVTLQEIGSPIAVNPLSEKIFDFLKSHSLPLKNLGDFHAGRVNLVISSQTAGNLPTSRKLSAIDISNNVVPFPAPAAKPPLPPLVGTISPAAPHFLPPLSPAASPPYGPHLPPCEPLGAASAPAFGFREKVWCVAKPSVPAETLQEALDFACGEGGADCEAIKEEGSCYFPDTSGNHAQESWEDAQESWEGREKEK